MLTGLRGLAVCSAVLGVRAAGAVSTEAVGNISGKMSYWAPALGFTRLVCLNLALGGEKPSIIHTGDAAVAQGGPDGWLWLLCPIKTMGGPHSPLSCGLRCRHRSLRAGQGVGSLGERAVGTSPPCAWAGDGAVAAPGDRKAI